MRVGITGAGGFIGNNLLTLLQQYPDIEVVDISRKYGYDLLDKQKLFTIRGIDVIIHLAGRSFVPESYSNPFEFYENNVSGVINILELCRLNKAKLIFASSYLYGEPEYLPIDELHRVSTLNPYAATKLIGENLCKAFADYHDVRCCILRIFNLYGPLQNEAFLIAKIIKQSQTGDVRLADPAPKRDFLYIEDLVQLLVLILTTPFDFKYEIFNIGYGKSYSIGEIIEIIRRCSANKFSVSFSGEKRAGEISDTVCNNSKVKQTFTWQPTIDLDEGLMRTLKFYNPSI